MNKLDARFQLFEVAQQKDEILHGYRIIHRIRISTPLNITFAVEPRVGGWTASIVIYRSGQPESAMTPEGAQKYIKEAIWQNRLYRFSTVTS